MNNQTYFSESWATDPEFKDCIINLKQSVIYVIKKFFLTNMGREVLVSHGSWQKQSKREKYKKLFQPFSKKFATSGFLSS